MTHLLKTNFRGDENIGFYALTSDSFTIAPRRFNTKPLKSPKYTPKPFFTLMGLFCVCNSKGILIPEMVGTESFVSALKIDPKVNLTVLKTKYNVLGNLILCNDYGAIISKYLKPFRTIIEETLEIKTQTGTIAGLETLGSCAVATNNGAVLHREVSKKEIEQVQKILGVDADVGTVNFGSPYIGSGCIANSHGIIVGSRTTGPEIAQLDYALGFLR